MNALLVAGQLENWARSLETGSSYLGIVAGMRDVARDLRRGDRECFTQGLGDKDREESLVAKAREEWGSDDCEIDDSAAFSEGDNGCWVGAWVWVSDDREEK